MVDENGCFSPYFSKLKFESTRRANYKGSARSQSLDRAVVEMQFLHAGDGSAIFGGGAKGPGSEGVEDTGVDTVAEGAQYSKI